MRTDEKLAKEVISSEIETLEHMLSELDENIDKLRATQEKLQIVRAALVKEQERLTESDEQLELDLQEAE